MKMHLIVGRRSSCHRSRRCRQHTDAGSASIRSSAESPSGRTDEDGREEARPGDRRGGIIGTAVREHLGDRYELQRADAPAGGVPESRRRRRRSRRHPARRSTGSTRSSTWPPRPSVDDALGGRAPQQPDRHLQRLRGGAAAGVQGGRLRLLQPHHRRCTRSTARRTSTPSTIRASTITPPSSAPIRSTASPRSTARRSAATTTEPSACASTTCASAPSAPTTTRAIRGRRRLVLARPHRRAEVRPPARHLAQPARLRRADRRLPRRGATSAGRSSTASPTTPASSGTSPTARSCWAGSRRTGRRSGLHPRLAGI